MRVAVDSNILVYFEGLGINPADKGKEEAARTLVERIPAGRLAIPAQVLGETYRVLSVKHKLPRAEALRRVLAWKGAVDILPTSVEAMAWALRLATEKQVQVWDAVILAVAVENRCTLLLSEDYQDGFQVGGTAVANPFTNPAHPLLAAFLPDGPTP